MSHEWMPIDSDDEWILAALEGMPPFGGENPDHDDESIGDGAIDKDKNDETLTDSELVQLEDNASGNSVLDGSTNNRDSESEDSVHEISKEDFRAAQDKLRVADESSSDVDAEKQEQLKVDFDGAKKRFDSAYYGVGLSSEESGKRMNLISSKLDDLGERDALDEVVLGVNHPEHLSQDLIDKINHVAEIIEGLDLGEPALSENNEDSGGEGNEDAEKKAEVIGELIETRDTKQINLLLGKIGLDSIDKLGEVESILNSMKLSDLERIQKEIEDELKADADKNYENDGENLEYLRSKNFGEWLAIKYDVPGPDSKYFNPNFFAADRKKQQQAMQEYMALFEADANYEKDRAFMVSELCRVEHGYAEKALEEMRLDPAETNMGDLEPMLNKIKFEELNELYRKVVYGPKPAEKPAEPNPAPKPGDPKQKQKPSGSDGGESTADDITGASDGAAADFEPPVDDDPDSDVDKTIAEKIKGIDKKIPSTAEDVRKAFADSPDARRIYGEPSDEIVDKTLEEVKVWKKLNDAQKAELLKYGQVFSGIDIDDLSALKELQKKGILPKSSA